MTIFFYIVRVPTSLTTCPLWTVSLDPPPQHTPSSLCTGTRCWTGSETRYQDSHHSPDTRMMDPGYYSSIFLISKRSY